MSILSFNNASDAATADDVRINSDAVRFVEASRPEQKGNTMIHLIGQGEVGISVVEPVEEVIAAVGGLAAAGRHYLAGAAGGGASTVYLAPANVSYMRPNRKASPAFWYVYFSDGYELRVLDPLPAACDPQSGRRN
jgi:hypothetical protein